MAGARIDVECVWTSRSERRSLTIDHLVIAGWTGRDTAVIAAHIEELAALGVPRPTSTPTYYRVSASLVTTDASIEVMGTASSGEVEPVVVAMEDGLWVGVGSDHTDREAEAMGVTLSKQLCPKPIAPVLWRFDEVVDHWDEFVLRSYAVVNGARRLYQEGPVSVMREPRDLIRDYGGDATLARGTVMFCGTMAVEGEIAAADTFEITLEDPVLGRTIRHTYAIEALPIAG